jgi:hypothetical protein
VETDKTLNPHLPIRSVDTFDPLKIVSPDSTLKEYDMPPTSVRARPYRCRKVDRMEDVCCG